MEFQQLEMFAAVVEEGSVTRAAERVYRTAPAVSIALKKLEDEMGAPLFDRSERHNQQLTAAGELLYSHARRILEMRREAETAVKQVSQQNRSLRIGTHESTSLYLLPNLISAFNEIHPAVKTEVICGNAERLLAALANRAIELAVIGDAPDEPGLESYLIRRDELVLITKPGHRLSSLKRVRIPDLRGEHLIVQGTKSMLRERIVQALRESDTPFNFGVENVPIEAIKRMVIEGLGIGFVPRSCVSDEAANGRLVAINVEGLRTEWNLSLVFCKDHLLSPTARGFVEVTIANAEPEGTEAPVNRAAKIKVKPRVGQSFAIRPRKIIHR